MNDRISRIKELIEYDDTALLITSDVNRRYFTGFKSSAGLVLITKHTAVLCVDFRYFEAAQKQAFSDVEVVCYSRVFDLLNNLFSKHKISKIIVEDCDLTLNKFCVYKENLSCEFITNYNLSDKILNMRTLKSSYEIECIKKAQSIAEKSFTEILNLIKAGVTERELAVELEYLMKKYGAEKSAFDIICVSGTNSSLPHGVPTDKELHNGDFITFDFGAVIDGYHSDMTRTVALGYVTDEMRLVYDTVHKAHLLAASTIKSGITCADVDNAARNYIADCGYKHFFGHSTGHGVGLEIHEKPTVYLTEKTILKQNMIITVEPGVYIPDKFGVRIEDMYLVKDNGSVDLTTFDKELIII